VNRINTPTRYLFCPICSHRTVAQDPFTEEGRRYQHYICDNPICLVSSFRIEWRT
jgi:hypothetical protein